MADTGTPAAKPADDSILDLIKRVAEVSIVLGAVLFVVGWSYIYGYYRSFGVSLGDIDLSAEVTLIYSFPVIFSWRVPLMLLIIAVACTLWRRYVTRWHIIAVVCTLWRRYVTPWHIPKSLLLIILLAIAARLVSEFGVELGRAKANHHMIDNPSDASLPPRVEALTMSAEGKDGTSARLETCSGGSHLRLLLHTHDTYFLFEPPFSTTDAKNMRTDMSLCVIPQERIRSISLEVPVTKEE